MNQSTLLKALLSGTVFLILTSWPAFAQHGGGHAGGGGGMHAGGGGMHTGGGGSFHGGGYSGGYRGGNSGGYSGRGSYAGQGGNTGAARSSVAGHPWSWEGHSSRDTSPGWHQFASGQTGSMTRSGAATSASRSVSSPASRQSGAAAIHQASIADGQWHSFAGPRSEVARAAVPASLGRAGLVSTGLAWRGSNFGVWRGGLGWRWGFGWPGWNWGWGWGCCGWGWGGFGWGWGFGWGAWSPFWAWPPYWYSPWLDTSDPPPYVLDPYPA